MCAALIGSCPQSHAQITASAGSALNLQSAESQAIAQNPTARAASQTLLQALAKVDQAKAQQRTQISFSSAASTSSADVIQGPPDHESFQTLQNTLSIPLPLGLRPRLAVSQAERQADAARAQFDAARITLLTQVDTAYYDLLRKQALLALADQTLAEAERALSDVQKRNKAGDVPELDVLRAQVPVSAARAARAQAENAAVVARQALSALLSRDLDAPLTLEETTPTLVSEGHTEAEVRTLAEKYSPDVRAAEATVTANEEGLKSTRLWREPALSLDLSDARSNDKTGFSRLSTIQATVTIPLTDGGLARGQTREAEAALAQAKAQLEASRSAAITAAGAAYLNARSAGAQSAATAAATQNAQVVYEKTLRGYQQGLFPLSDVLNAQSALAQARIAEAQARYDRAAAESTLALLINPVPEKAAL